MTACEGEVVLLAFIERGDGCGQGYVVGLTCGIGEGEEGGIGCGCCRLHDGLYGAVVSGIEGSDGAEYL